ncbi:MAG: 50S ribosomal protein L15 [bacterium]
MALEMHNLKSADGSRSKPKRVGRGNASGKGTTAGRGTKGQAARTGGRNRRQLRGFRQVMLATPKLRGFRSLKVKPSCVKVSSLDKAFVVGESVTPASVAKKGLVSEYRHGVKIVGGGTITKKLHVSGCLLTAGARKSIEVAGGQVE